SSIRRSQRRRKSRPESRSSPGTTKRAARRRRLRDGTDQELRRLRQEGPAERTLALRRAERAAHARRRQAGTGCLHVSPPLVLRTGGLPAGLQQDAEGKRPARTGTGISLHLTT